MQIADAEIERLKKDGPTAAEVRKAQNERESELVMGLQSVTRKAAVLNEYMDRLGDPLGYRTELDKVFAVTPDDVKRVANGTTSARIASSSTLCPVRRRRASAGDRPSIGRRKRRSSARPSSAIKDDFDRLDHAQCSGRPPTTRPRASSAASSPTAWSSGSSSATTCRS